MSGEGDTYTLEEKKSTILKSRENMMRTAAKLYYSQWKMNPKSQAAFSFLKNKYNLSFREITKLGLGFHDGDPYLTRKVFSTSQQQEEAEKYHLVFKSNSGTYCDKMRNSIIIPTVDLSGNVQCFDFYSCRENRLHRYPKSEVFNRRNSLYSLNLAVKTGANNVFIVTNYTDYFLLVSHGIWNVVSTYFPSITEGQMDLLKRHFAVVLPLINAEVNFNNCRLYTRKHNMYTESVDLQGEKTVQAFLNEKGSYESLTEISDEINRVEF